MKRLLAELLLLVLLVSPTTARQQFSIDAWYAEHVDEQYGHDEAATGTTQKWSIDPYLWRVDYQVRPLQTYVMGNNVWGYAYATLAVVHEKVPEAYRADVLAHEIGHVLSNVVQFDWAEYRWLRGIPDDTEYQRVREDWAETFRVCFVRPEPYYPHRYAADFGPLQIPLLCDWMRNLQTPVDE